MWDLDLAPLPGARACGGGALQLGVSSRHMPAILDLGSAAKVKAHHAALPSFHATFHRRRIPCPELNAARWTGRRRGKGAFRNLEFRGCYIGSLKRGFGFLLLRAVQYEYRP